MLIKSLNIYRLLEPVGIRPVVTLIKKYPRKVPSILLAEGILPKLTADDMVYEEVKIETNESPCINVLLVDDVPGLGSVGTVTPVHRNKFWRYLYIKGLAELPTEERINEMKSRQKERPTVLCGESYVLQQRLSNMTLYIPMNPSREWTLNKTHVKVALRRYGFAIKEHYISLPKEEITSKNPTSRFKISVNIDDIVNVDVPCSIFLYQKLDKGMCTQPPTNVFRKIKIENWTADFSETDKKFNNSCRFFSYFKRQAYEPIRIKQLDDSSIVFTLSDLNQNGKVALAHFDHYYSEAYGPVAWLSMRIALLMPPKKAILYNRYFPNVGDTISSLYDNDDNNSFSPNINFIQTLIKHQNSLTNNVSNADKNPVIIDEVINVTQSDSRCRQFLTRYSPSDNTMDTINLNEFMPSTELISENEMYTRECDTDFTFYSKDYYGMIKEDGDDSSGLQSLKVLTENFHIPEKLYIKCSPPGRLVTIPHPTYLNGQFNLNTIDLSSVITILALNLQKNDNMVNMSTFSGTKSVIALQTGLLNRLLCVLRSPSRSTHIQQMINTFKASGINSEENDDEQNNNTKIDIVYSYDDLAGYFSNDIDKDYKFNKILVNVPCSADRYAITSGDSHVFGMGQAHLRAQLPKIQLNLLRQAMELCQPNGYVVYSTSTLSPSQNQEIIQSFILNHSNNINFALINLKPLYDLLTTCYSKLGIKIIPIHLPLFDNNNMSKENHNTNLSSNNTCHGLLIIPSISCNYGPTFIVKFKRLP
ncbi:unnamed protein product [Schistosoma rodhaini]|uniref:NOL1/NOP2/Sun domain family member 4 n=1 Tax=Schistosoma rodhaini TaxID=6188 RepID=A0AA85ERW5_9TREM|nr:unnamed protein product [Schistosoma rodhaini]